MPSISLHREPPHPSPPRVPDRPIRDRRAWTAAEADPRGCVVHLSTTAIRELVNAARHMLDNPLPTLLRAPDQLELTEARRAMYEIRTLVDEGPGFAVLETMPLDELETDSAVDLFWVLGQMLGRPVAQKWDGSVLYHVRDTGRAFGYGVRGSHTNVELGFHTDNAFAICPPDRIGLLCLHPARRGGASRFCSIFSIHNHLLERYPAALDRLYRPVPWDRQAEHEPRGPKVGWAPIFTYDGETLSARINTGLVRNGYRLAGETPDTATDAALDALQETVEDPALWIEMDPERGHLQYLNNRTLAHYRERFEDFADPDRRRHLVRTWHRDHGRPSYDG